MRRLIIPGLLVFSFLSGYAQLRELEATPMTAPDNIIQGSSKFPDNAMVLVYSSIADLQFRSSMGAINLTRYDPSDNAHYILVSPVKQILSVVGKGYIELQIQTINPQPKGVLAFKVEEKSGDPLAAQGTLVVGSDPTDAVVWVNGIQTVYRTPARLPLPRGATHIKLQQERYLAFDTVVSIRQQEEVRLDATLLGDWANVSLRATPAGATYRLEKDGIMVSNGLTPVDWIGRDRGLNKGNYRLVVSYPGYRDEAREFTVKAGDRRTWNSDLILITGRLEVNSTPPGAAVYLDNVRMGVTPFAEEIKIGKAELVVRMDGYREVYRTVELQEGRNTRLSLPLERALKARLQVASNPSGAQVLLDGVNIGTTPLDQEVDLSERRSRGTRRLQIVLQDYDEVSTTVDLQPTERPVSRSYELRRKQGRYRITSSPSGAEISANGIMLGVSPATGVLPTGQYTITANKPKYSAEPVTLQIRENRNNDLDIRLRKVDRNPTDRFYWYFGASAFIPLSAVGPVVNPGVASDDLSGSGTGFDTNMVFMLGRNIGFSTALNWTTNFNSSATDQTYFDRYILYAGPVLSLPLTRSMKMEFRWATGYSAMDIMKPSGSVYELQPAKLKIGGGIPPFYSFAKAEVTSVNFRFGTVLPFYLGGEVHRMQHRFSAVNVTRNFHYFTITAGFCIPAKRKE